VNLTGGANGLGDGKLHGNEDAVALKLPIPQSFQTGPLTFTVQEHEFRMANRGLTLFALVGRKIGRRPTPASSIDIVMLIGSSIRREV
jgi:hypothetical protein